MTERGSRVLEEALALPAAERAKLAERLLSSLEPESELSEEWVEEIESRIAAFERGELEAAPAEEAFERALKKSRR